MNRQAICWLVALLLALSLGTAQAIGVLAVKEGGATVTASGDTVNFGSGFDLTESPTYTANVSLDLSEVSVPNLNGLLAWIPANGEDDYRSLTYIPGAEEWGLASRDFSEQPWSRQNIQNASGNVMVRAWNSGGAITVPWIAPRAGRITAVTVCTEVNVGANGTYTVTVYKNGVSTGVAATIPNSAYKARNTLLATSYVSFAASDELMLVDSKSGSVNNTGAVAQWFGLWVE